MSDRPPSARWRLFIAAPMPEPAAAHLWDALAPLRERYPQARWARREQLHVTLVFLGQTDTDDVPRLAEVLTLTASQNAAFQTSTGEAGGRADDRRGGVAWLRLADHERRIRNLAREIDWRIGSGIFAEARPRPHLTVARRIDEALLADLRAEATNLSTSFTVQRIVLYRSHAEAGGSRYEALAEQPLTGPPPSV